MKDTHDTTSNSVRQEQFEKLYQEYAPYAVRTAVLVLQNHHLASDAVQETFLRVYLNLHKFDWEKPFKPWFYKILINECRRIMEKHKKVCYLNDFEDLLKTQDESFRGLQSQLVLEAISKLDELIRIPFILKYLQGFEIKEISEMLKVNPNTIKSRLHFGKGKLRKLLNFEEGDLNDR